MNQPATPAPLPPAKLRAVFSGLLLAMLLAALDSTIVATALPTIVLELGNLERLSWVVTSYLLAQTIVIPMYGKLGDLYGRRVVLQAAIVIFVAGSALCGLSQSLGALIGFRALQGLGGGGLIVTSQAAIGDVVSPRQRGRYQGILGAAFGVASIAGPLLGGFFTTQLSWRWIFYINLPLGLLALGVIRAHLPAPARHIRHTVDYAGALVLSVALASAVLLTDLGGLTYPWMSPQMLTLGVVAVAATVTFVLVERRATEPLLPLHLFRNRTFAPAAIVSYCVGFALFGSVTYLPMFLQLVKQSSPTRSGLELVPMMAGTLLTSIGSGQLISRFGRYRGYPIGGMALATLVLFWLSQLTASIAIGELLLRLFLLGSAFGMVTQVLVLAVQNAARYEDLGVATSGVTMFRLIGGSAGTAVLGSVFAAHVGALPVDALNEASAMTGAQASAVAAAVARVFLVAAGVAAAGFLLTWIIPERRLRETIAASGSSVGKDAGDAFAMPGAGDPASELLRGLTILANRDAQRAYIASIVNSAGLSLQPTSAWLLLRFGEQPGLTAASIARDHAIPAERIQAALEELRSMGYVSGSTSPDSHGSLTETGLAAYGRLAAARRQRLQQLYADWPESQRQQLAFVLQRLSHELIPGGQRQGLADSRRP